MSPIVMTLVFSVAMLMFMGFPAMKIVEIIATKKDISKKTQNILTIVLTIFLSLIVGTLLQFG